MTRAVFTAALGVALASEPVHPDSAQMPPSSAELCLDPDLADVLSVVLLVAALRRLFCIEQPPSTLGCEFQLQAADDDDRSKAATD